MTDILYSAPSNNFGLGNLKTLLYFKISTKYLINILFNAINKTHNLLIVCLQTVLAGLMFEFRNQIFR